MSKHNALHVSATQYETVQGAKLIGQLLFCLRFATILGLVDHVGANSGLVTTHTQSLKGK